MVVSEKVHKKPRKFEILTYFVEATLLVMKTENLVHA